MNLYHDIQMDLAIAYYVLFFISISIYLLLVYNEYKLLKQLIADKRKLNEKIKKENKLLMKQESSINQQKFLKK